jgi:hypothetical protein
MDELVGLIWRHRTLYCTIYYCILREHSCYIESILGIKTPRHGLARGVRVGHTALLTLGVGPDGRVPLWPSLPAGLKQNDNGSGRTHELLLEKLMVGVSHHDADGDAGLAYCIWV